MSAITKLPQRRMVVFLFVLSVGLGLFLAFFDLFLISFLLLKKD